jgi:hypothetical protein
MKISKYEFDSQEAAELKIAALPHATDEDGNEYATHSHTIVKLGNIVLEKGEYDEKLKHLYYQTNIVLMYYGKI